jgi:hypothetical protein
MATSLRILSAVVAAAVLVALGRHMSMTLDGMMPMAAGPSPYFVAGQAAFLYLWVPFVALCAAALFLAPGLTLALGIASPDDRFETWLLKGFTLSVFGVPTVAALVHAISGLDMTGAGFIALLVMLCLPGLWIVAVRDGSSSTGRISTTMARILFLLRFCSFIATCRSGRRVTARSSAIRPRR